MSDRERTIAVNYYIAMAHDPDIAQWQRDQAVRMLARLRSQEG